MTAAALTILAVIGVLPFAGTLILLVLASADVSPRGRQSTRHLPVGHGRSHVRPASMRNLARPEMAGSFYFLSRNAADRNSAEASGREGRSRDASPVWPPLSGVGRVF